jgi:O-antigen/teichoic acid export membrane protein
MIVGNMIFGTVSSSAAPMLNGVGKSQWLAAYSGISAGVMWAFSWPALTNFGILGFAYISLVNWLPTFSLLARLKSRWPNLKILTAWLLPVVAAILTLALVYLVTHTWSLDNFGVIGRATAGLLMYIAIVYFLDAKRFRVELRSLAAKFFTSSIT